MATVVNLSAAGLNRSPNPLSTPNGSLTTASNVVISRENVVESRRGFKLYGDEMPGLAKQLLSYKDLILRHYGNTLQWDDGTGSFTSFSGSYTEPQTGLRIKGAESNGNFYFTTDSGIKKISAKTADELSADANYITNAGGVKALDTKAILAVTIGDSSGFLPIDSAVAYRITWGIKDANANLVQGTPSQRAEIYNPASSLVATDLNTTLHAIDVAANYGSTLLSSTDYQDTLGVLYSAAGSTLRTNILALAAKIDDDILYANDSGSGAPLNISAVNIAGTTCTITVAGTATDYLSTGSIIKLTGFTVASGTLNGIYTVSSVTATTIVFTVTASGAVTFTTGLVSSGEYEYITQNGSVDYPTSIEDLEVSVPATAGDLALIQDTLDRMIARLKLENSYVINATALTNYILPLAVTTTANVTLDFTIPDDVTINHFYQVYRSSIVTATGVTVLSDLTPSDELQLVYEGFPTSAELTAQYIQFTDVTPDQFRGANLYTNASTGEGILQANDVPPAAKDITVFKNYTFYGNTRTKHRYSTAMLGVQQLITSYNAGAIPVLTIGDTDGSTAFTFVTGVAQVTDITCTAQGGGAGEVVAGQYFTLNSSNNERQYYFWYKVSGAGSDPAVSGRTGVRIDIETADTASLVAAKTRDAINTVAVDFIADNNTLPKIRVTNVNEGPTTLATVGTTGFTVANITTGRGENLSTNQVLLSQQVSVALAVDATARSLVKVINRSAAPVYAYYLSGSLDVPGKILIESRTLENTDNPFYVLANNTAIGTSFNPVLSPESQVDSGAAIAQNGANLEFVVLSHGLLNGDQIFISGTGNTTPALNIDGIYRVTKIDVNTFSIVKTAASANVIANSVGIKFLGDTEEGNNEVKANRLYYSKLQQPEAVPILNTIDLGAENKAILRIVPQSDSLFVFKEDGLFRVSGETAPFSASLFDGSCFLVAPDSLGLLNNAIYGWTRKGIEIITESGVQSPSVSRPIDVDLLPLASSSYTNFKTVTWGIGYESDNSYIVYTLKETTDEVATIAYRFSNLTNSWTTYDKTNTCGIVSASDDRLYLGAGDVQYLEQERKNFDRTDYADRELIKALASQSLVQNGYAMHFASVTDFEVGDVIVQDQFLTVYEYNALLQKLDIDSGVNDSDYYETLRAYPGDNLRIKIVALATKLDADTGVNYSDYLTLITGTGTYSTNIIDVSEADPTIITTDGPHGLFSLTSPSEGRFITISGLSTSEDINSTFEVTRVSPTTFSIDADVVSVDDETGVFVKLQNDFRDVKTCYNLIIDHLNSDIGVFFRNYNRNSTSTIQEAVISAVDPVTKTITLNLALDYVVGNLTLYKRINTEIVYSPQTMEDPMGMKHLREATIMFENKAFTSATISFSTDLLPEFVPVNFNADSNGIFGNGIFFGAGFFGGASNSTPFRTYIPATCQRCRYIVVSFEHAIARERYAVTGISITGETSLTTRAYK